MIDIDLTLIRMRVANIVFRESSYWDYEMPNVISMEKTSQLIYALARSGVDDYKNLSTTTERGMYMLFTDHLDRFLHTEIYNDGDIGFLLIDGPDKEIKLNGDYQSIEEAKQVIIEFLKR